MLILTRGGVDVCDTDMDEGVSEDESDTESLGSYPEAAAKLQSLASTIFLRLTAHSRFPAILLAPAAGVPPLPSAAARLALPLPSALPLCECDPTPEQV